ncbi:MAG: hypothetical protein K9N05_01035 [Candidatus Marinimicrobia bacterium]|nr:hypothetical protein [Candidatus Neomarinimicrobiota bacterium]
MKIRGSGEISNYSLFYYVFEISPLLRQLTDSVEMTAEIFDYSVYQPEGHCSTPQLRSGLGIEGNPMPRGFTPG